MIKINRATFFVSFSAISFLFIFYLSSCKNLRRNTSTNENSATNIQQGKELSKKYCQGCHILPDPSLLSKKTWESGVLPVMGPRLGIFEYDSKTYPSLRHDLFLDTNFYPSKPLLSQTEWENILNYFIDASPDSLLPAKKEGNVISGLNLFKAVIPPILIQKPATCFVKIDERRKSSGLIVGDATTGSIYVLNDKFTMLDSVKMMGPIVDIDFSNNQVMACNIGVLNPNNGKFGSGQLLSFNPNGMVRKDSPDVFIKFERPVQIISADFNNDKKIDYLVCEF
jgi:hypothetical protein